MKKPSKRWSENIGVEGLALAATLFWLFAGPAFSQPDPRQAAQDSADQALSKFGSPEGIRQNASNPLTSQGALMTTIDNKTSFNAQLTCPSSSRFLNVLISPTITGDLSPVLIGQDADLDGAIESTYQPPFPISGVCANGVISCAPGQWASCRYYQWTADSGGRANLQEVSQLNLGGCYCVNNSCGANLAMTHLPSVLQAIGGGVVGAIQANNPKMTITDVKIDGTALTYFGQNAGQCTSTGSSPEQYFNNPGGISTEVQSQIAIQSVDPMSHYGLMTTTPPALQQSASSRQCVIQRSAAVTSQQTFCQNPAPTGSIASREETIYLKVYAGSNRSINDCRCSNVTGYCAPPPATVYASVPEGAIYLGASAENFRDRSRRRGEDRCTYDAYDYYSLCTRTSDVYSESVTDSCNALEADPNCRLREEQVDAVGTYGAFNPTGLTPLPSCTTLIGLVQNHDICRDWWKKQRTYLCQTNQVFDFTDAKRRAGAVIGSVADNTASVYYRDLRKDQNGNWISEDKTVGLPGRDSYLNCEMACKTRKPTTDTEASMAGNTAQFRNTTASYDFFYKNCVDSACPLSAGEEVVKSCQCISDFAEAASLMEVLKNAGSDMICSDGVKQ